MAGSVGNWDPIGARTVELNSVAPTACSGSDPTIPVRTRYSFYDSAAAGGSMIRVERRWAFGLTHPSFSGTHGLRAYVPRLAVGTYDQVIYPKADESGLITTTPGAIAFSTDWNGKWVALNSSSTNSGLLILRDPGNASPATVVTDSDGGSDSNLSGVTLLRPLTGWQAPLTETEYLCFYDTDAASWPVAGRSATNLPQGCSARPLPINTAAPTVSGGAGNPLPGATLTASPGSWENSNGSFAFQWLRCEGAACTEIGGATSANYIATAMTWARPSRWRSPRPLPTVSRTRSSRAWPARCVATSTRAPQRRRWPAPACRHAACPAVAVASPPRTPPASISSASPTRATTH